jgi:hypothetical protein
MQRYSASQGPCRGTFIWSVKFASYSVVSPPLFITAIGCCHFFFHLLLLWICLCRVGPGARGADEWRQRRCPLMSSFFVFFLLCGATAGETLDRRKYPKPLPQSVASSRPQSAALLSSPNLHLVSPLLFSFPNPMAAEVGGLGER